MFTRLDKTQDDSCKEVLHHVISNIVSLERGSADSWQSPYSHQFHRGSRSVSRPQQHSSAGFEPSVAPHDTDNSYWIAALCHRTARHVPAPGWACRGAGAG